MILPSNDYILLGCGIMPGDDETLVAIKGEKGEYLHNYKDLTATNCQLLPNGYMMTNTQCTEMNRHVYFEDVKVMDQKRNVIVNFPIHRMSHECIFGSNAPRYYTPAFDYSTLNTNVLSGHIDMLLMEKGLSYSPQGDNKNLFSYTVSKLLRSS